MTNSIEQPSTDSQLQTLRILLYDALDAGGYLPPIVSWVDYLSGEMLYFRDKSLDIERTGKLVLAPIITNDIIADSISAEHHIYVVVGGRLSDDVKLGKMRTERVHNITGIERHYWATFVLENSVLLALGTPPSPCRLMGEVLNLQVPTPFVQSRICPNCYALNAYHSSRCETCEKPLQATGRLG